MQAPLWLLGLFSLSWWCQRLLRLEPRGAAPRPAEHAEMKRERERERESGRDEETKRRAKIKDIEAKAKKRWENNF